MKKTIGFVAGAGIIIAVAAWFINKNPAIFQQVINWALKSVGIS